MTPLPSPRSPAAGPAASPFRRVSALALGIFLGGLLAATTARAADEGLAITTPWVRSVLPGHPAAGYFTLTNNGATARSLVGAASPACGTLMLHQSIHQGGQERMVMVKSIPLPAHGKVTFGPGGYHLMCMKPSTAVTPGHSISVTLRFADGTTLGADFPVRGATGK